MRTRRITVLPSPEEANPLEFRILGPLEIVDGERTISIRAGNDRAVLVLLLLHANKAVSSDRLVDELWGETPPQTAPKILQSSVSRLRRVLGTERVETRGHGYVMHVAPDELDASRFERLVRERKTREALALWRGPPLADLDGQAFATAAARRLEEIRLDALENRIDEDIAGTGGAGVVAELESLTAEYPFRERLQALLMRALYAEGRQKESLEVYRRTRRVLADELGLEPGPELQELERAILRQDPALPRSRPRSPRPAGGRRRPALAIVAAVAIGGGAVAAYALTHDGPRPVVVPPNSVVVIDSARNRVTNAISLGGGAIPGAIAAGSSGVWVTNAAEQTVVRIDPRRLSISDTYNVGGAATDVALGPGAAWVVTGNDNTLVRLDAQTGDMRTALLPATPAGVFGLATGGGFVWLVSGTLLKFDPRTQAIVARAKGNCCDPLDVAYGRRAVWVAERAESVAKVGADSVRRVSEHRIGELDGHLAVGYGSIWAVGLTTSGTQPSIVWRLNPETGLPSAAVPLGRVANTPYLTTVAIATGAGSVWVAIEHDRAVFRLDPRTGRVLAEISTDRPPIALAVTAGRVWVTVH